MLVFALILGLLTIQCQCDPVLRLVFTNTNSIRPTNIHAITNKRRLQKKKTVKRMTSCKKEGGGWVKFIISDSQERMTNY